MDAFFDNDHYLEIEYWLNKSKDYLEDARILIDYGKHVGPISRIYYSNFYCAKALLLLYNRRHKRHSALIGDFGKIVIKQGKFPKRFGRLLNKTFDLRQSADYSDSFSTFPRRKLKILLKTTQIFINYTQNFITERIKSEIKGI
ncbi:MAG: HEPN domain-containing protein [Candidatus Omnitrophica bacterium]|nr:HEPN domain-containing protein [Candidatus Omnitrophota bacterium]